MLLRSRASALLTLVTSVPVIRVVEDENGNEDAFTCQVQISRPEIAVFPKSDLIRDKFYRVTGRKELRKKGEKKIRTINAREKICAGGMLRQIVGRLIGRNIETRNEGSRSDQAARAHF